MKTKTSTIYSKNVFSLLISTLLSALIVLALIILGGGGFVSGDVLLFSFVAFIVSLTPVFISQTAVLKPGRVRSTWQPMIPRKDITHINDPLLM